MPSSLLRSYNQAQDILRYCFLALDDRVLISHTLVFVTVWHNVGNVFFGAQKFARANGLRSFAGFRFR